MNTLSKRTCWLATGLLVSLGCGPVAYADDTELFVAAADPTITGAQPNILFIIDTSGSMTSGVVTQKPWDATLEFNGPFDTDSIYWSTTGTPPGSGSSDRFPKSRNECQASAQPLAAFGTYEDNFYRWRNWSGTNSDDWVELGTTGNRDVECQADAGVHGDGGTETYAANGAPGPWTTDSNLEISWNNDYTIWDGNYLNWLETDGEVDSTRIDVVKDVTTNLLQNIDGVNVGLMRFDNYTGDGTGEDGGPVIFAMEDIATARTDIIDMVNDLPANSWTPLSETFYEAGQYWAGRSVDYGNIASPVSVADSRDGGAGSNTYDSPLEFSCQKNYTVILTDGAPTRDTGANTKITSLPGFAAATPSSGETTANCGGTGNGVCLDDMAEYLYNRDLNSTLSGVQNAKTYTIGFTVDLALLKQTAIKGGTGENGEGYYLADNTATLANALTEIVSSIKDDATTFTSPAVPVNAFNRTQNLRDVFVSVFQPTGHAHWPGNLKKYRIQDGKLVGQDLANAVDTDTGFFSNEAQSFWTDSDVTDGDQVTKGGAANELPFYSSRNLYTNATGTQDVNLSAGVDNVIVEDDPELTWQDLGLPANDEPLRKNVVNWTLGLDVPLEVETGETANRFSMGDPLHVRPVAIIYGGTGENPDMVVYTSTNDGVMHAIDADTGEELWGFIPQRLLDKSYELYVDPTVSNKRYGLDGEITPYIINDNGQPGIQTGDGEKVFLVFGMRRGGDALFALDVTDRESPRLAWVVDSGDAGFEDLGQTWSRPTIGKVNLGSNPAGDAGVRDVVIIGGGYDTGQDSPGYREDSVGAAVFMLDLATGTKIWSAGNNDGGGSHNLNLTGDSGTTPMEHSIPAPVRAIDITNDDVIDRMYVGDMGGRLWRFDIKSGNPHTDLVEGGAIASLGAADLLTPTSGDVRRLYAAPDVVAVLDTEQPYLAINVGSGHRAHPLDTATNDEFFSVRDFSFAGVRDSDSYTDPVTRADLIDVTDVDGGTGLFPELAYDDPGWRLEMVRDGEKILTESLTFAGTLFFTSFQPGGAADACSTAAGTNRVYQVSVRNGAPLPPDDPYPPVDPPQDPPPPQGPDDRITTLKQGGIAPDGILLFPDGIYCAGTECFDPNVDTSPQRTYWFQDETR